MQVTKITQQPSYSWCSKCHPSRWPYWSL